MSDSQEIEYEIMEASESGAAGQKKRGRKSKEKIIDELGSEAAAIEAEIEKDRRVALIDERFGDGQPYDRTRLEVEVKAHMQNASEAFLQAGRRLIQIKEHEGHGDFLPSLERIGIGVDVAQKMMFTVRKIQDTQLANADALRHLLPSKLYEIALLDQDQIEELGETGATGFITLDEIQRMTTREAKAALREERRKHKDELAALEQVVKKKNELINKQELQISLRPEPSQKEKNEARLKQLGMEFVAECNRLQTAMRQMRDILDAAARLPEVENIRLQKLSVEIITYGTEAVIAEWEGLTEEVVNLKPKEGLPNVPALG